jgi:hypothetical protein
MFHELRAYLFCCPPTAIDSFDFFNILELVDSPLRAAIFQRLHVAQPLAGLLLWTEMRMNAPNPKSTLFLFRIAAYRRVTMLEC